MRYRTGVQKLRQVVTALDEDRRVAAALDGEAVVAAYAYGAILEGHDPLDAVDVAFVVDRPASQLPWGAEPAEVRRFVERHRLDRVPLRWVARPADGPIDNHVIERPARLWTVEEGPDDAVLEALTHRRFTELPRLAAPDPDELTARLEVDAEVCLRELDALMRAGPPDPHAVAVELYDLVWGYTDLLRALGRVSEVPSEADEPEPPPAWDLAAYRQLVAAVRSGDGTTVVALLDDRPLEEVAQAAGAGLLVTLAHQEPGADTLATRCAAALRERDWIGDPELADELDAARGEGALPLRRAVPVDLDELASALEGEGLAGEAMRLDLATGELWPEFLDDLALSPDVELPDDLDDPDAALLVEPQGSRDGYRDMERFLATITDRRLVDRLERALEGRGAFRRFRDLLRPHDELWDRWQVFSDERTRGRARAWLALHGYRAAVRIR